MLDENSPVMQRVLYGAANDTDKEWLALLWDFFINVDLNAFARMKGMDKLAARDFKGLVALAPRYLEEAAETDL